MFLEGVLRQLFAFSASVGVKEEEVIVRITFVDGDVVVVRGLNVVAPFGGTDWGMIRGTGTRSTEAIVVREEDVRKVEFQLAPQAPSAIGFSAVNT